MLSTINTNVRDSVPFQEPLSQSDLSSPWWEEKSKTKALPALTRLFQHYAQGDQSRLSAYNGYSRLYTNRNISDSSYLSNYGSDFGHDEEEYSRVPLNVAKVMIDAVHARLTRPAVRVEFLSSGGPWSQRTKAKQMSQFVAHQYHKYGIRERASTAVLDALIYGLGCVKTCPHPITSEVVNERVHPRDIFVDPIEAAATGQPTHLYQRLFVAKGKLMKMFPNHKQKIHNAGRLTDTTSKDWSPNSQVDMFNLTEVVEAWKLPSWKGAGDGKHAIFVDGAVLEFENWEHDDFPFSFVQWKKDPTLGFFGVSLCEELIGIHYDINTSILHVQKAVEIMPKPYILVPGSGEVNEGQLGNVHGTVINYTDRAPQIVMPQSIPGDVLNYIGNQWQNGLQIARLVALGLPESAGGQAETGQAFKDIVDIQSTELAPNFKLREAFLVRLAEQQIVAGKALDIRLKTEGKSGFETVLRKDRNTVQKVEWGKMALDPRDDSYVVQAMPASALSVTFGGRLAEVKEMLSVGLINPSTGIALLDFPDTDQEARLQNASKDYIERVMEEILDEGKYTEPEPTMDLRLGLKITQKYINLAQAMDVEDKSINMLLKFLRAITDLIKEEQEATRMQAAGIQPGFAGGPPALDISGQAPAAAPEPQGAF